MEFFGAIETVGKVIDAVGVATIALGGVLAAGIAVGRLLRRTPDTYRLFRSQLGRAILVGLELLVAADIIRTVAVTPTLESVGVLAGIVLIRTFLSWSLELRDQRPLAVAERAEAGRCRLTGPGSCGTGCANGPPGHWRHRTATRTPTSPRCCASWVWRWWR